MKNKPLFRILSALALFATGHAVFYYSFVAHWIFEVYLVSVALLAVSFGALLWGLVKRRRFAVLGGTAMAGLLFGTATFCRTAVDWREWVVALIFLGITGTASVVCLLLQKRNGGRVFPQVLAAAALTLALAAVFYGSRAADAYYGNYNKKVASPVAGKTFGETERPLVDDADLYVSPDGSDDADGSFTHPLATIEKARDLVRATDKTGRDGITVALKAGEYRVSSLAFTPDDGGTESCPVTYTACGDGEAVLNGGVMLPRDKFVPVTEEATLERLSADAQKNVLSVDLFALGITAEQYGKLYAIGNSTQAGKYDGDWTGPLYCELFIDDQRQTVARYPNGTEYLRTGEVVKEGQGRESHDAKIKEGYDDLRNPEPDVYRLDDSIAQRIQSWKTTEGVWLFGYPRYDWADVSSPLGEVDYENMTISPMFVSGYGAVKGAPFYFYNILEELDAPGEWFLDRDNGILYFYPPEGFSEDSSVELSLTTDSIIKAEADYLTFDGLTVKGTRGDAVRITGNGNTVKNCLIKNAAGYALTVTGYDNLVTDNEITRTGKGGVILSGGDRETLTPGNNRAENNLVHDWSEIYETYQPAFTLNGVGNICSHNEMYNSPHEAITYSGNDHVIEYNLIHDVNLKTDDGGAIYSGRRWDWYGNVIRYNLIYDLGADGHKPQGIYMDDGLSGQTIYGNILINVPNNGLMLGCGRDLDVHDNIVINSRCSIQYDNRMLDGLPGNEDSNFYPHYKEGGDCWVNLFDSPWQSETWQKAYPQYARYSDDFSNPDDPDFVLNPSYSTVTHNLLISVTGKIGNVADEVLHYSTVEDNAIFRLSKLKKVFVDPDNGDYTLRDDAKDLIGFAIGVPAMSEFGRQ